MSAAAELHGADPSATAGDDYEVPEEYAAQGDTRVIRALRFIYTVSVTDPSGLATIEPREAYMGEEVTLDQIGLTAQMKGEGAHSFYTTVERARVEAGQNPDMAMAPQLSEGDVASLGEYELSEYIKGANPDGKELTVNETIALAGTDKDLAHRLLQAENIATDGEPRKGVEAGLTAIIEG